MTDILPAGAQEKNIGLEYFYTNTEGLGGRLRTTAEDFRVIERSDMPLEAKGHFTAAIVTSRNWETNRLVRKMAKNLRISRRNIMFCGTKDKRAITTQLFVFQTTLENVNMMHMPDVTVEKAYSTHKRVNIGDLFGNQFEIVLRNLEKPIDEATSIATEAVAQLKELGGFPNYFGVQRFGAVRPITHKVGRYMIEGQFKEAADMYLFDIVGNENPGTIEARQRLKKEGDYAAALVYYPDHMGFEKAILNHLALQPDDYVGALEQLPKNLLMMFIHAYQSYIFNKTMSERMAQGLPLNEPVPGDAVLKVDKYGLPDHRNWVTANDTNIPKLIKLIGKQKAFISAPLIGHESEFAEGQPGEIELKIFEAEKISQKDFIIPRMERMSSKGTRREVLCPLNDLGLSSVDKESENPGLKLDFDLNKGCYATTLLREFMKSENLLDY